MIIWGHKGYKKLLGTSSYPIDCGHCNNQQAWQLLEVGKKFTLYFIPLFPYGRKYYLTCPICGSGMEIDKKDLSNYLSN